MSERERRPKKKRICNTIVVENNIVIEAKPEPCPPHPPHHPRARALTANYAVVTASADIQLIFSNKINPPMPQTINVLAGQNTVPGQLVPVADDNTTIEPIETITAGSEVYTTSDISIATAAAVVGGAEGQFTINRVLGAQGTVTLFYTATTPDGRTITNIGGLPDTFNFQGQPTGIASALTANFGPAV